jgi:fatty acid desaturase
MQRRAGGAVFAHSPRDGNLVLVALAGVALLALSVLGWPTAAPGPLVALWLAQVLLLCTNYQCVAHNFVHNEFFRARWANAAMSMLNSVALGFPQSIFREHHFNHHRYNNQAPSAGADGDLSSLYRYSGQPGEPEPFLRYVLLSPLRADVLRYARAAVAGGHATRLLLDTLAVAAVTAALAWHSPAYFALYYLPLLYFGHVVTYAEGYFEHNHAVPGDRMRNAVSCYSRWYNFIWFNNGYHQEHHCYPGVHWTKIAPLRGRMLPESQRRVVAHAHWVNF